MLARLLQQQQQLLLAQQNSAGGPDGTQQNGTGALEGAAAGGQQPMDSNALAQAALMQRFGGATAGMGLQQQLELQQQQQLLQQLAAAGLTQVSPRTVPPTPADPRTCGGPTTVPASIPFCGSTGAQAPAMAPHVAPS